MRSEYRTLSNYSFSLPSITYMLCRRSDTSARVENKFDRFTDTSDVAPDPHNRDVQMVRAFTSSLGHATT